MILSRGSKSPMNKNNSLSQFHFSMADSMFMYYVTAGIFAFLTAVVFGARARRYGKGYSTAEGHTTAAQHE